MKSIIAELYYGNISGNDVRIPKEKHHSELKLYDELRLKLSNEDKDLLEKFIAKLTDNECLTQCETYKLGFKTGFMLGFELAETEEL